MKKHSIPTRPQDIRSDAIVPLARAISAAFFVGPLAGSIAHFYTDWVWYQILIVSGLTSGFLVLMSSMFLSDKTLFETTVTEIFPLESPPIEDKSEKVKETIRWVKFNGNGKELAEPPIYLSSDSPTLKTVTDVPLEDLTFFIKAVGTNVRTGGETAWRGVMLPSGQECKPKVHSAIVKILSDAGMWSPSISVGQPATLKFDWRQVIVMMGLGEYA